MAVSTVRLSARLVASANASTLHDWQALLGALPKHQLFPARAVGELTIDVASGVVRLELPAEELVELSLSKLESTLDEYYTVIDKLEDIGPYTARAEALDMGKRVIHEAAARALARHLPDLANDHEVFRAFFSLVAALARPRPATLAPPSVRAGAGRTGD
ncbi:MAG: UPF0262 family protein [Polyangiaceae bacterium]